MTIRVIDLFAGLGGTSLGAEQAGADVVWAANHWQAAVDFHRRNHPRAQHLCQDLHQADWSAVPYYDLLLASPACQGHSEASQPKRRPAHDASRSTAWAVVSCADITSPAAILVENVPAFQRWKLYPVWCDALRTLGYTLDTRIVRASHFGVPQRRDRLFIVCTRGKAFAWPEPETKEPAIRPFLDLKRRGHKWTRVCDASKGVKIRIAAGREKHGRRFVTQHVTGHRGIGLGEPLRTITKQDQFALVDGDRYRPLTVRETARGMGFPDSFELPDGWTRTAQIAGLGNAVPPPVAKALVARLMDHA